MSCRTLFGQRKRDQSADQTADHVHRVIVEPRETADGASVRPTIMNRALCQTLAVITPAALLQRCAEKGIDGGTKNAAQEGARCDS